MTGVRSVCLALAAGHSEYRRTLVNKLKDCYNIRVMLWQSFCLESPDSGCATRHACMPGVQTLDGQGIMSMKTDKLECE